MCFSLSIERKCSKCPSSANCVFLFLYVKFCSSHLIKSSLKIRLNCHFISLHYEIWHVAISIWDGLVFFPTQSTASDIIIVILCRDESCGSGWFEQLPFNVFHAGRENVPVEQSFLYLIMQPVQLCQSQTHQDPIFRLTLAYEAGKALMNTKPG